MSLIELVSECVTAAATAALAIAAWVEFPLISKQVKGLADQIEASRVAEANAERRTREWNTLEACQRYDFDPVLENATARIWDASRQGTDYKLPGVPARDITCLLNYLDGLAIGIEQGLYVESIVRDHLAPIFEHAVQDFLDSQIIPIAGLERVRETHLRWRPATSYKSGA